MFLRTLKEQLRLSTVRQTVLLLAVFSVILLLCWGGTYWVFRFEMQRGIDARLSARMEIAVDALTAGRALPEPGPGETIAVVETDLPDGFETRDVGRSNNETRYLLQTTPAGQILIGEDVERLEELRDILAGGMQLSLVATLISTVILGIWLARRGQARLNTINAGLARVASGRLDQPIELDGTDDIALLADRINLTTERLSAAMTQIRVQSSNIAHDLRTPLARVRAKLETSLIDAMDKGTEVNPDVLEAALEQIDQITGTFEALLRLSRLESGAGRDAFTDVNLGDVVVEVSNTFGPVVEEAGQSLVLDSVEPGTVSGDRGMLVQLLANLIQNALRYGAEKQRLMLRVHGRRIVVSDEGPGIAFSEREKVFLPLYQSESTRQGAGFGLGLSLVRAIADLHDAGITLGDGPEGRGLVVTVEFPKLTKL